MSNNKEIRNFIISSLFVIVSVIIGLSVNNNSDWHPYEISNLSITELFLINLKIMSFYLILSLSGPICFLLVMAYGIETGMMISNILSYYNLTFMEFIPTIAPHGFGEFIVICLINNRAISMTSKWISYFKNQSPHEPMEFMKEELRLLTKTFVVSLPILLVSSYLEINLSKPYFGSLLEG